MHLSKTTRQILGAAAGMAIAAALSALFGISSVARHEAKPGAGAAQPEAAPESALV